MTAELLSSVALRGAAEGSLWPSVLAQSAFIIELFAQSH